MQINGLPFSLSIVAALFTAASLATAQTRTDIHRDAATRNVGDDPFMMTYARASKVNPSFTWIEQSSDCDARLAVAFNRPPPALPRAGERRHLSAAAATWRH